MGTVMRSFLKSVALLCLLLPCVLEAQQAGPADAAAATPSPQAIDPMLAKPAGQLTPEQIAGMQKKLSDWPQLARYHDANQALPPAGPDRVVFFGDSITDAWAHNNFFPGKPYLDRGIGGQTTAQMVVRFQQDVVALRPAVVVILAGINDIAGNTGVSSLPMIEDNLSSMVEIAQANNIRVVLSSVLPASDFPWRPGLQPAPKVRELNRWISRYASTHHCVYLDYYTALAGSNGGMKPGLSRDEVHPTAAGYAIMAPLAEAAICTAIDATR